MCRDGVIVSDHAVKERRDANVELAMLPDEISV
jgi:hypothetical protein